ncbi:hypothetical protein AN218_04660 [Streptomyces nanshensis]|uniref:Uncharacterized protein n=1 Tax=Streptomyces nanshensis TaxID=518642 RepID=A0A1E7LAT4_9ACTN|nr:hypothetical protein AN218_04660 [Streptomyces nanshensis]
MPRRLRRLGDGRYITGDGRYRLEPYNDATEVTRGRGPRRWYVIDTTGAELPRTGYTLARFREEFCGAAD